jgi:hypothetical protein
MEYQRNIRSNGEEYVTAFAPELDTPLIATDQHPNYARIIDALQDGAPASELEELFDVSVAVARTFDQLTERVAVGNGRVYFDGDELHEAITDHIVRALEDLDDDKAVSLARFLEKLASNPSKRSREQLYEWLQTAEFTIGPDGDLVAYKGVTEDLLSINSGKAIVDGELHENGRVPNELGSVIEFPRSEVVDDAAVGCARGLHVGTWDYAEGFARGAVLKVAVNPRDVVSVPSDCSAQKVRVCRYQVIDVIERPVTVPVEGAEEVPETLYGVFIRALNDDLVAAASVPGDFPSRREAELAVEEYGEPSCVSEGAYEVHELDEYRQPLPSEDDEPESIYRWDVKFLTTNGAWANWTPTPEVRADSSTEAYALLCQQPGVAEDTFKQALRWTDTVTGEESPGWVVFDTNGEWDHEAADTVR